MAMDIQDAKTETIQRNIASWSQPPAPRGSRQCGCWPNIEGEFSGRSQFDDEIGSASARLSSLEFRRVLFRSIHRNIASWSQPPAPRVSRQCGCWPNIEGEFSGRSQFDD